MLTKPKDTATWMVARKVFRRPKNRGAGAELARRLSPNPRTGKPTPQSTVSLYLQGKVPSARIDAAAIQLVSELARKNNARISESSAIGELPNA
jgi:hypothetical protein